MSEVTTINLGSLDVGRLCVRWARRGWSLYTITEWSKEHNVEWLCDGRNLADYFDYTEEAGICSVFATMRLLTVAGRFDELGDRAAGAARRAGNKEREKRRLFRKYMREHPEPGAYDELADREDLLSVRGDHERDMDRQIRFLDRLRMICSEMMNEKQYQTQAVRSMEYKEYLKTENWRTVRLAMLIRSHFRCQICNGSNSLEVHHRSYKNFGDESLVDLIVLDRQCHHLFSQNGRLHKEAVEV